MATLSKGKVFTNGELVTPATLHSLVDSGTVTNIVNADISNTAAIADSKLAQITTAGKVANTATTATSANTANAIVSRDAGGSFTAGTITAALSGNAATATTASACSGNAATATTLQTARTINGVSFNGSGNITVTAAPNAHTHAISDTTGLQTALDGKQASGSYAAAAHNHDASAITSGTLANARTTATSANTANAIVARDASGDFLAGKINGLTVGKGGGSVNTNTALGVQGLNANTSGFSNTAVGYNSLQQNTTGYENTAVGTSALLFNTTGSKNSAFGANAFTTNTTGYENTAIGDGALFLNSNGYGNTAIGYQALLQNSTARGNTACGIFALTQNTTGNDNTAVGFNALFGNTTGTLNTAIGMIALQSGNYSQSSGVGYNAQVTGSSQLQLGNSTATTYAYGAVQDRSDVRDKADIRDTTLGLEFVNALRPVDFKWDMREDYRPEAPQAPDQDASQEAKAAYQTAKAKWMEDVKLANITHDGSKKRGRYHHGLIAQEVKAVLDSKGIDFGGYQDHSIKGGDDVLSIGYEELIAPMLKAIQELSARVAALEAK